MIRQIRPCAVSLCGLMAVTLCLSSCSRVQTEEQQDQGPTSVQLLLTQAQSLSLLELASVRLKTTLRLDPHRDGLLGFKKLFGSKETDVVLFSQASVRCDLSELKEDMIRVAEDSTIDLTLPPLMIRRELEEINREVTREATGLRRRIPANELDDMIRSKQGQIDSLADAALQREKPQLFRRALQSAETRLAPIWRDLKLTVRVHLNPEDERILASAPNTSSR